MELTALRRPLLFGWSIGSVLLLLAAGCLAASLVPTDSLLAMAGRYSLSGDPSIERMLDGLPTRLQIVGAIYGLLAALCLVNSRRLGEFAAELKDTAPLELHRVRNWAVRTFHGNGFYLLSALLLFIAVGTAIRAYFLREPIRFDEAWTYESFVRMPTSLIPLRYNVPNNHILNSLLIKLSTSLFGSTEAAIRLPALFWGVLSIPACFALTWRLAGVRAALIATALLVPCSILVEYSALGRGYSCIGTMFLLMLLAGYHAAESRSVTAWTVMVIAGVLGAYAIPIMALPAATACLWILFHAVSQGNRSAILALLNAELALAMICALVYLPVLAINGFDSLTNNEGVGAHRVPLREVFANLPGFALECWRLWTRDLPPGGSLVLAAGALAGLTLPSPSRAALFRLLAASAAVVFLYLAGVHDLGFLRVWIYLVPLVMIAAGIGFAAPLRRLGVPAVAVLALLLCAGLSYSVVTQDGVSASAETGVFPDAHPITVELLTRAKSGDLVVVHGTSSAPLLYYARRLGLALKPIGNRGKVRLFEIATTTMVDAALTATVFLITNARNPGYASDQMLAEAGVEHGAVTRVELPITSTLEVAPIHSVTR
jgi:hypothetical protein